MISGKITATISDLLSPFLFPPNVLRLHAKNPIFAKEHGQKLFKQTLHLTLLMRIGLMCSG